MVGYSVHYVARGSADGHFPPVCRAAIIAAWPAGQDPIAPHHADLVVLNPNGQYFDQGIRYSPTKEPGTWHYNEGD